jgi:hypothetical protein
MNESSMLDSEKIWARLEPLLDQHAKLRPLDSGETAIACYALFSRIKKLSTEYAEALQREEEAAV